PGPGRRRRRPGPAAAGRRPRPPLARPRRPPAVRDRRGPGRGGRRAARRRRPGRGRRPARPGRPGPDPGRASAVTAAQDGQVQDARVIPVPGDEAQWGSLLEVGSEIVARGGLVVLPTDTLYGVGCDPFNPSAVDALFVAKQRGRDLPLPVLVHTWRQAVGLVEDLDDRAQALIAAWWPGPLTLVFKE